MKKLVTWYKNTNLSTRVIFSMNMAIFFSILIISVFATINRINVQKSDARALVNNELNQVTTLLEFLQERPLEDLENIIQQRVLYNTGFISIVSEQGDVLVCRERQGQNISTTNYFNRMKDIQRGEIVYTDPVSGKTNYQYHTFFAPLDLYVTATLEKSEFIDKPVFNTLKILLFALIFTWIAFSLANYFIMKTITTPMHELVFVVRELGKGNLADTFHYPYKDEVGQIAHSVNELVDGLRRTTIFANEIGKNNFDHPFEPLSDKDVLGNALLDMRKSLKTANEEEKIRKVEDEKRNWTTQGLAKFADILRQNNDNMEELSYDIIRNLVDYLGVNQGGMFIYSKGDDNTEKYLELTACYAFDRRKYLEKKILPGEGLVGTCFLEKEPIYITQIPQDYIRITSGLGDENPSSLLLMPLKINDQVFGVIELASFTAFEKYKLEFVEKIGESIASTISSVRINTQTAALLEKSQQQAEEMRAQEEEMRQNMEELSATQEAMSEKDRENIRTIENLTVEKQGYIAQVNAKDIEIVNTLEYCPQGVVKFDKSGLVTFFNTAAEDLWGYTRTEVMGEEINKLMAESIPLQNHEWMQRYLDAKRKAFDEDKKIGILLKSGQTCMAYLTLVETGVGAEVSYTGFFTCFPSSDTHNATMNPDQGAGDDQSSVSPGVDTTPPDKESKADDKPGTTTNLHEGEATDNQKAWSEHITQKGKTFRKSKKK